MSRTQSEQRGRISNRSIRTSFVIGTQLNSGGTPIAGTAPGGVSAAWIKNGQVTDPDYESIEYANQNDPATFYDTITETTF